jgi:hypothetical protein
MSFYHIRIICIDSIVQGHVTVLWWIPKYLNEEVLQCHRLFGIHHRRQGRKTLNQGMWSAVCPPVCHPAKYH